MSRPVVVLVALLVHSSIALASQPGQPLDDGSATANATTCRTFVSAGLVEEEHWTAANSPYCIMGPIQVSLLTIDPGVEVLVDGHYEIEVLSTITAEGTAALPIRFGVTTPGECWAGLRFQYTPPGSSLRHCIIEDSDRSGMSLASAAPPVLSHVLFRHNSAPARGGAIAGSSLSGDLEIRNSTFDGNTAREGGGAIYLSLPPGRVLRIADSTFTGNASNSPQTMGNSRGGAIWLESGDSSIVNSIFDGNVSYGICSYFGGCGSTASATGGAVQIDGSGTTTIANSIFVNNRTDTRASSPYNSRADSYGGAVYANSGTLAVRNSLFACNDAAASGDFRFFDGAAIGVGAATAAISWSTVTRNPIGTGISTASNGAATIEDSIVFFNNGDGTQLAGTPVVSYSNVQGGAPGDGNISLNPVFSGVGCDPTELVIVAGSPCIDAGNPDPTRDDACFPPSRGLLRSDMGAHGGPGACDWVPYRGAEPPLHEPRRPSMDEVADHEYLFSLPRDADRWSLAV